MAESRRSPAGPLATVLDRMRTWSRPARRWLRHQAVLIEPARRSGTAIAVRQGLETGRAHLLVLRHGSGDAALRQIVADAYDEAGVARDRSAQPGR